MTLKHRLNRQVIPWLVAVLGITVSVFAFFAIRRNDERRIETEFLRRVQSLTLNFEQTVVACDEALRSLRDLYHYSEDVTRSEFTLASADIMSRHPAISGIFWAPQVHAAKAAAFEAEVRADTQTDFAIHPAPARESPGVLYPILYASPYGLVHVEGIDLMGGGAQRPLQQRINEGSPGLIGHGHLLSGELPANAALLAIPVYGDCVPTSEAERRQKVRGVLVAIVDPSVMLAESSRQVSNHGLQVILFEMAANDSGEILGSLDIGVANDKDAAVLHSAFLSSTHAEGHIISAGLNWMLLCRPSALWLDSQRTYRSHYTAALNFLFCIALAFYLHTLMRQTAAVEQTVALRTRDLQRTQQELQEDIRRRTNAEAALKLSEERYRLLVKQSADAIYRLEFTEPVPLKGTTELQVASILARARVAECNETARKSCGHETDLVGLDLCHLTPHSDERRDVVLTAFVQNNHRLVDFEASQCTGEQQRVFLHSLFGVVEENALIGIWMIERELTAQRRMEHERQNFERRLADAQRLESLGVLAGGIAHDFNNLLTGVLGHASLGRAKLPSDSELIDHFEQIENASRSAANLCQQMLAYAGKGRFVIKLENLSRIIASARELLHSAVSKQVDLRFHLDDKVPPSLVDATQIQQIVMNLVINASEAIGQAPGIICLTTGVRPRDDHVFDGCALVPERLAASYVYLEVKDSGAGMNQGVLSRIFEPFFTTKFAGRGLGLAATIGIVRRHSGALRVESTQGRGSTFTLYLPTVDCPTVDKPPTIDRVLPFHGEGTMLVVDDEEPVRTITARIAQSLGFAVLTASDGTQGLSAFKEHHAEITVVLLDLSMPGTTGDILAKEFQRLAPDTRIILMSGYNQPEVFDKAGGDFIFLPKPFNVSQFQAAVQTALKPRQNQTSRIPAAT